ncbi:MAG: redoxin domain-containing protein [Nitrospira sp.]|nr:redoxin domain-containing protein [Nitrospira sp.]
MKFQSAHAELFGCDSFFSHKAWADSLDLKYRFLSDFNREVVKKYGLFRTAELRQARNGHRR